jgi:two-component system chemotaxis response regulator CheY
MAINRNLLSMFLKARGCAVDMAEDGMKALEQCKKSSYDLVFSDIEMPNMNGIEFLRAAKRLPAFVHTPFVMPSTVDTPDMKAKAKALGAFDYMVKPFTTQKMDELFTLLAW